MKFPDVRWYIMKYLTPYNLRDMNQLHQTSVISQTDKLLSEQRTARNLDTKFENTEIFKKKEDSWDSLIRKEYIIYVNSGLKELEEIPTEMKAIMK